MSPTKTKGPSSDQPSSEWERCSLYIKVDELGDFEPVELMRLSEWRRRPTVKTVGLTNEAKRARDELAEDAHSMRWIYELGRVYDAECNWEKVEAVYLRGWKRAGEIQDIDVRFTFLLKLAEVSYYVGHYKQAAAVIEDIEEPSSKKRDFLKAYLLLNVRIHASNEDIPTAMKFFQKVIEGEDPKFVVSMLAIVAKDLKRGGAYDACKAAVEKKIKEGDRPGLQWSLDVLSSAAAPSEQEEQMQELTIRYVRYGVVGLTLLIIIALLYWLEQKSLQHWQKHGKGWN